MKLCKAGIHSYPDSDTQCKECKKIYAKKYKSLNRLKIREKDRKWTENNKQYVLKKTKEWRKKNLERAKKAVKDYYLANKLKVSEINKRYSLNNKEKIAHKNKIWRQNNRGRFNANSAKYKASKLQATPKWLTKEQLIQIERYYLAAKWIESILELKIEVDHIVPIQGKNVCGLHVPWNLQLLLREDNRRKNNKIRN